MSLSRKLELCSFFGFLLLIALLLIQVLVTGFFVWTMSALNFKEFGLSFNGS